MKAAQAAFGFDLVKKEGLRRGRFSLAADPIAVAIKSVRVGRENRKVAPPCPGRLRPTDMLHKLARWGAVPVRRVAA